jgi:4-amino-4-deoxy-L-arabinose transferase-like glycosyltransferase
MVSDNNHAAIPSRLGGSERFSNLVAGLPQWMTPRHLLLASGLWLAALAWARPLSSPDETRYTDIPRWMVESGDWLVPRINGLPFAHKPPLYFWMEAALIKIFGLSSFVARLPSLCASILICACVYRLVRDLKSVHAARWSVAVLVFSPLFYGGAQYADLDMLVASLITVTITCAFVAMHCGPREARKEQILWLGAYAAAGLGMLAKGLIGVVLPGSIVILYIAISGQWSLLWRAISIPGLAVFAAIVLPWFVGMEHKLPGYAHHFFVFQHFTRYTTAGFNNPHGIWFYPAILLGGMLPWTIASRGFWPELVRKPPAGASLEAFALIWLLVTVVFFSIPASKIVGYIFPALPAFAILIGPWVAARADRLVALGIGASLCAAGVAAAVALQPQGPSATVAQIRHQIAPEDNVVFYNDYFFDAALTLDRTVPTYVLGDWSRPSIKMGDNVPRQLTEGREFDPQSGRVLISALEFAALSREPRALWVVLVQKPGAKLPEILEGLTVAAAGPKATVLRNGRK